MNDAPNAGAIAHRDESWRQTLRRLHAFVAARVGDPNDAADITQDVIVRSIAAGVLEQVDNPTAWLYRSTRNAVIDHYRSRRYHDTDAVLEHWPDPGQPDNAPSRATRELAHCLQPLLAELAPAARDALTRVDLDGQTHRQAASELGISVSGMKSRVQRARRQLKEVLTRCCEVEVDQAGSISTYRPSGGARCCQPEAASSSCCAQA